MAKVDRVKVDRVAKAGQAKVAPVAEEAAAGRVVKAVAVVRVKVAVAAVRDSAAGRVAVGCLPFPY